MLAERLNGKIPGEVCCTKAGGETINGYYNSQGREESAIWRFSIDLILAALNTTSSYNVVLLGLLLIL